MTIFHAIFLGVLQGLTEFLPVSSSGHLVLAEYFMDIPATSLAFDVTLHIGTLLAVLIYFWHDWLKMAIALFAGKGGEKDRRLLLFLILGTIPGAMFGFFFEDMVATLLRSPWVVASTLSGVALLLFAAEKMASHDRPFGSLKVLDAIVIGSAQALALVPGVSRSGITMTAGLFLGLDRQAAARFSFLLSAPIVAGAGLYEALHLLHGTTQGLDINFLWGFLAAFLSGLMAIAFLMRYLVSHDFYPFVAYRLVLAAMVVMALLR